MRGNQILITNEKIRRNWVWSKNVHQLGKTENFKDFLGCLCNFWHAELSNKAFNLWRRAMKESECVMWTRFGSNINWTSILPIFYASHAWNWPEINIFSPPIKLWIKRHWIIKTIRGTCCFFPKKLSCHENENLFDEAVTRNTSSTKTIQWGWQQRR